MRPTRILYAILSFVFILMIGAGRLCAQTATANTLQHPKDQIALQLGAIQMGYTVPFTLTGNISTQKMQQAVNALVMGRNSLNATVAKPAVQVVGAVDSPSVDTVEYRDQLYAAVEYVVTSPVVATIKGSATVTGNKKVSVAATKLTVPPNAWTIPVPYALESRSSADVATLEATIQALRNELVGAGVLPGGMVSVTESEVASHSAASASGVMVISRGDCAGLVTENSTRPAPRPEGLRVIGAALRSMGRARSRSISAMNSGVNLAGSMTVPTGRMAALKPSGRTVTRFMWWT